MQSRFSDLKLLTVSQYCFGTKLLGLVIIFITGNATPLFSQLTISEGTFLSASDNAHITVDSSFINQGNLELGEQFVLTLNGEGELVTTEELNVPILVMDGINYEADGNINIMDSLLMKNGSITPLASTRIVVRNGGTAKSTNQSHVDGMLYAEGEGLKFFPVGTNDMYTPVILNDVVGDSFMHVGIAANNFDLGVADDLENIQASIDWHWAMDVEGNYEGSEVRLPIMAEDQEMFDNTEGIPVVIESNGPGLEAANLDGEFEEGDFSVLSLLPAQKSFLLLGVSLEIDPIIHNIITAGEDADNPFLIIDNIDALSGNEVTLIDRWGNVVFQENDFKNYNESNNLYQGEFDELSSGNYVCIVKYKDKSFNQMVTVIRE